MEPFAHCLHPPSGTRACPPASSPQMASHARDEACTARRRGRRHLPERVEERVCPGGSTSRAPGCARSSSRTATSSPVCGPAPCASTRKATNRYTGPSEALSATAVPGPEKSTRSTYAEILRACATRSSWRRARRSRNSAVNATTTAAAVATEPRAVQKPWSARNRRSIAADKACLPPGESRRAGAAQTPCEPSAPSLHRDVGVTVRRSTRDGNAANAGAGAGLSDGRHRQDPGACLLVLSVSSAAPCHSERAAASPPLCP
jgi:hypothetical protein